MKTFGLIITCSFLSFGLFAQKISPKVIEADLLKSFKRIQYWGDEHYNDSNFQNQDDSLEDALGKFERKLKKYTSEYPSTLAQKFPSLIKAKLSISTSDDGLFRIYSWDTWGGGTMHEFANVYQYKVGNKTFSKLIRDTSFKGGNYNYVYWYNKIYTLKTSNKTFYLAVYNGIYSSLNCGQGIQVFSLEKDRLNEDVKIIRTQTGFHSQVYYEYVFDGIANITFDPISQIIKLPLIAETERNTHKFIRYKFNGQYFEKIK